ncbi:MAG: asparaginase [Gammaproteobacteria bacterium]|nr:asparaginase [Gammaproteobacteria bacterium]
MAASNSPSAGKVVVLGTGGTISGRAASAGDNIGYVTGQVGVAELLDGVAAPPGTVLHVEQVAQVDSKDMSDDVWLNLASRCAHWLADPEVAGVVVAHGTDTLEETAFYLQAVLACAKPIVLTCAMRPSTALSPDGPPNLRDAIVVAATEGAQGVMAVCAGVVHGAMDVQKMHTYRLDAFGSGDAGPIAYVEEGVVRRLRDWPTSSPRAAGLLDRLASVDSWPRVDIVLSHAGASGEIIDALVDARSGHGVRPVRGLVLAATGNGTLHHALEAAAQRAQAAGVAVVRATRCAEGRILPKASDSIADMGALTPVKARVALMLDLLERPLIKG